MFNTSRIKFILIAVAMLFAGGVLFYSQNIVSELRNESKESLIFYTELYARLAGDAAFTDYGFFFDEIIPRISFPIIITVPGSNEINAWKNIEGIPDTAAMTPSVRKQLLDIAERMDSNNAPVPLEVDDQAVGMIHYGDSRTIRQLTRLPYIEILGAFVIIFAGFLGFQYVRSSEKQFIWVGLAKETAHQLGTPISSLMGWLEMAKEKLGKDSEIVKEMDIDIRRLEKVSNRFAQIGAKVKRKPLAASEFFENVKVYIERRIPQKNKAVTLNFSMDVSAAINANQELLEWALENLIKNGVDALEGKAGRINVTFKQVGDAINIDVEDTGKGIPDKEWKNIFKPGYSTKKRGWGMGLSLTKRIIEEYHQGRIFVKSSKPGKGTCIRVILKGCCSL
ncbi:MAG: HAMP domain-containing sensor histidine kinase [Candidatus Marinimicrobia bacterium]|nr:HAMP domain-containing sensor histidine kinase [Candidatus Neomarinimicrobiota bacterium]